MTQAAEEMKMNSKKAKFLALAALLMFVGATFQIANEHFIPGIICFGAAAAFTASANVYRERAKKEKQEEAGKQKGKLQF